MYVIATDTLERSVPIVEGDALKVSLIVEANKYIGSIEENEASSSSNKSPKN
jgi:hypothetical protein